MSRPLTRTQVLAWRENWSFSDRELINHALDVLGEEDYYEPNSKTNAAARVGGKVALHIAPGYLYWKSPKWTEGLDPALIPGGLEGNEQHHGRWYTLSTFRPRTGSSTPNFEELSAPCPDCFLVPSVSGHCDCD